MAAIERRGPQVIGAVGSDRARSIAGPRDHRDPDTSDPPEASTMKSRGGRATVCALVATAAAVMAGHGQAQTPLTTEQGIEQYREMLQDGNPAELNALKGEELWKKPRGPKNASLEQCDLGLGAGVVKGAYAQLPRWFADTDQVMDFESRLVHCLVTLQGFERDKVIARPFSGAGQPATDIENLVAFVTEASRGDPIAIPQKHPKEIAAAQAGEKMFYFRGGPYDFSCATCHSTMTGGSASRICRICRRASRPRRPLPAGPPIASPRGR